MQLDRGLPDREIESPPVRPQRRALPPLSLTAFGQNLRLNVTSDLYLHDDSHWRLRSIYEPALAAQTLAVSGVALDIGAGFGCFALPFALANRGWTVWAFEPEPEAFAALCTNIKAHKASNVIAVNAAVTGQAGSGPVAAALSSLAQAGPDDAPAMDALLKSLTKQPFRRHRDMQGVIEHAPVPNEDFEACDFASIPAEALVALNPSLLKLTAPLAEAAILEGLTEAPLDHVIGESWSHIPAELVYGRSRGQRQTWIPRAGDPLLRLRRAPSLTGHRQGLDIVVAMFNSAAWIEECLASLLADGNPEVRVLVVDDGSTDGSGALVQARFGSEDRLQLLTKDNGGCASARNYGRLHSDASHIAFVDADDMAGPGLFTGLLDLARHTGAEIVQGGFDLLQTGPDGKMVQESGYESHLPDIQHAHRHAFGDRTCLLVPSALLIRGQPSIWRRVYRRDYLDNRAIWFPEHVRAFDDQLFQLVTLQHVPNVPMLDGVSYLYRQHPAQDIRQGDARHFYSLEMFRLVLKRGITEGWNDFRPVLASYANTVNWCWQSLRPDLRPAFVRGTAELWAYARLSLPQDVFADTPDDHFAPPDFAWHSGVYREKLRPLEGSYGAVYLDAIDLHPAMQGHFCQPGPER